MILALTKYVSALQELSLNLKGGVYLGVRMLSLQRGYVILNLLLCFIFRFKKFTMLVTVTCASTDTVYSLEVSPDIELENFKTFLKKTEKYIHHTKTVDLKKCVL